MPTAAKQLGEPYFFLTINVNLSHAKCIFPKNILPNIIDS